MSQPPDPYQRQFSFTGWSVNHPGEPHQGDKIDLELNEIRDSLNATQDRLAEIQNDDGTPKTGLVVPGVYFDAETSTLRFVVGGVAYSVSATQVP